jgi:RNA polymerase sigma-70 factor, ECF subfamily
VAKTTEIVPKTAEAQFDLVISRLRSGDEDAANEVFRRYVDRLIALASRQFDSRFRSKEDPEDVVLSVYRSFFRRDVRAPYDLEGWDGLWALLATITIRKCIERRHFWKAARRDVARESSPPPGPSEEEWREAIDRGPTPEQALILNETLEFLVGRFEPSHRELAALYFNGYSAAEIAELCPCSERTVRRVVARFREGLREIEAECREG